MLIRFSVSVTHFFLLSLCHRPLHWWNIWGSSTLCNEYKKLRKKLFLKKVKVKNLILVLKSWIWREKRGKSIFSNLNLTHYTTTAAPVDLPIVVDDLSLRKDPKMEIDLGSQQDGRIIYSDSNLRKCDNTKGEEKAGLLLSPCLLPYRARRLCSLPSPSSKKQVKVVEI